MPWRRMAHRLWTVLKTALIVVLGALVGRSENVFPVCEVIKVSLLGMVMQFGLYVLNEATDIKKEEKGKAPVRVVAICWLCIVLSLGLAYWANPYYALFMGLIATDQFIYSFGVFRLKRFVWAGPVLSGIVSPTLRFMLGLAITMNSASSPKNILLFWIVLIAVHLSFSLKTRAYRWERDKGLGYSYLSPEFTNRFLEPLQFLSPFILIVFTIFLRSMVADRLLPSWTIYPCLAFGIGAIAVVWRCNKIYDSGRHQGITLKLDLYHGLGFSKINNIISVWELLALMFVSTPALALSEGPFISVAPIGLALYCQFMRTI